MGNIIVLSTETCKYGYEICIVPLIFLVVALLITFLSIQDNCLIPGIISFGACLICIGVAINIVRMAPKREEIRAVITGTVDFDALKEEYEILGYEDGIIRMTPTGKKADNK